MLDDADGKSFYASEDKNSVNEIKQGKSSSLFNMFQFSCNIYIGFVELETWNGILYRPVAVKEHLLDIMFNYWQQSSIKLQESVLLDHLM